MKSEFKIYLDKLQRDRFSEQSLHNSLQNNSILGPKIIQKSTRFNLKTTPSTEFDDNEQNATVDDFSTKPYDSLTNYLTISLTGVRPCFLGEKVSQKKAKIRQHLLEMIHSEGHLLSSCVSLDAGLNETNM